MSDDQLSLFDLAPPRRRLDDRPSDARRPTRRARVRGRSAQQRRARGVRRHRQDERAGAALRQPAQGAASSRPTSWRSPSRARRPPRCASASSASCARPRRCRSSTARAGRRCAIGSARSPSARSTRSACRCCASSRSRRTSIPGFDIADETEVPRLVEESLDQLAAHLHRRWPSASRTSRWCSRSSGVSRTREPAWPRCSTGGSSPGERSTASWRAGRAISTPTASARAPRVALRRCCFDSVPGGLDAFLADGPSAIRAISCSSAQVAPARGALTARPIAADPRAARPHRACIS